MSVCIEVIAPPPHQAPEFVRNAWVGLELPLTDPLTGKKGIVVCGLAPETNRHLESIGGFEVAIADALSAMDQKDPAAARWLREESVLPDYDFVGTIVFAKKCAVLVF